MFECRGRKNIQMFTIIIVYKICDVIINFDIGLKANFFNSSPKQENV